MHSAPQRFLTSSDLAQTVATAWLDQLENSEKSKKPYFVAFSGGRIAQTFFGAVLAEANHRKTRLDGVHFFWADERCVPPDDTESNFRSANQLLLQPLGIETDRIHRIQGELKPEAAARQAEDTILQFVPSNDRGQPVLDLVFLGMGEDGHIASLFPGDSTQSDRVFRPVTAPKPPPRRITIGYQTLAAVREVWILVSGQGKESALRESLRPEGKTPMAKLLQMRSSARIFTDLREDD